MYKINVVTLCSGYGSQEMALKRLKHSYPGFDFNILAWSEIDNNAIKAYKVCHPEFADRNAGDLTKADFGGLSNVDLLFYSTPCQSVSVAGKRKGMKEGSDAVSSLIWHVRKIIETLKPKVLILENVKGMTDSANIKDFNKWQETIHELGYANFTQILDTSDYNIPQHRERVFMVSILNPERPFYFPKKMTLEKRLKDVLEKDVDSSYYLSDDKVEQIISNMKHIADTRRVIQVGNLIPDREGKFHNAHRGRVYSVEGIAPCMHTCGGGNLEPKILEPLSCALRKRDNNGKRLEIRDNIANSITTFDTDSMIFEPKIVGYSRSSDPKGRITNYHLKDIANTIHTCTGSGRNTDQYVADNPPYYRIRKLTQREVYRLQGVSDEDIDRLLTSGISRTKHYQLAGNSITVDVLFHILRKLYIEPGCEEQQLSLF